MSNTKKQLSFVEQVNSINGWLNDSLGIVDTLVGTTPEEESADITEAANTSCGSLDDKLALAVYRGEKLHRQLQRIFDRVG